MPANMPTPGADSLPLRPLHLPDPPGFWPPAPGWWLLLAIVLLLFLSVWLLIKYQRRSGFRRAALKELEQLQQSDCNDMEFLATLSTLLRRAALVAFPASDCAGLQGEEWLMFLDGCWKEDAAFTSGPGKILGVGPYQRQPEYDRQELLTLCRRWLKKLPTPRRVK